MAIGDVNWVPIVARIAYWGVLITTLGIMGGGGYFAYYYTSFPYKIMYWPVVGRVGENGYTIDKPKKVRARLSKDKTWQLMFKKKAIRPFASEHIYSGKNCYAMKIGEEFIPCKITTSPEDRSQPFKIEPVNLELREWYLMDLKKDEELYKKKDFWDENRSYITAMVTVIVCCAALVLTVYWVLQFASGGAAQAGSSFTGQIVQGAGATLGK